MKAHLLALCLAMVGVAGAAHAQADASASAPAPASRTEEIALERARIAADRTRAEDGFLAEDAACYKRFAVNRCLDEVHARRRLSVADLRRQEILLNDEERKMRGAEQIRKTEEKASPEKQQEAADRRAKAAQDYQQRLDQARQKEIDKGTAKAAEQGNAAAAAEKLKGHDAAAQARTTRQAQDAAEAATYAARQKAAQERRAQHDADQLKRTKPPSNPLPVPP